MMPILKNSQHVENLLSKLADSTNLCDIILVAGNDNEKIPAHRLILNEYEYFRALLSPQFREGSQDEITLQAIDGSILKSVKKFLYTGCIEITEENVRDIIHAASSFELTALEDLCGQFWGETISVANCVDILLIAEPYCLKKLASKAIQFIHSHFKSIASNDFLKMDEQVFRKLLEDRPKISPCDEIEVFNRLKVWINSNGSKPAEVYSELLKLIRLKNIGYDTLRSRIEPFFKKYDCEALMWREYANRLHKIKEEPSPSLRPTTSLSRKFEKVNHLLRLRQNELISQLEYES